MRDTIVKMKYRCVEVEDYRYVVGSYIAWARKACLQNEPKTNLAIDRCIVEVATYTA